MLIFNNPLLTAGISLHIILLISIIYIIFYSAKYIKFSKIISISLFATTIASIILFYTSPYRASELNVIPDSVELAVSANRIAELGTYDIEISKISRPPRYPPGFSLTALAPYLYIFGSEPGNGIYAVLFFSIIGVISAFLILLNSGGLNSAFLGTSLLLLTNYTVFSGNILSHIPVTALTLLTLLSFLVIKQQAAESKIFLLASGLIIAYAISFRPLAVTLTIPFLILFTKNRRFKNLFYLIIPVIISILINLIYNNITFGSPFHSGYNYWCAVPYDYFTLLFNQKYILPNLIRLFTQTQALTFLFIIFIIYLIRKIKHQEINFSPLNHILFFLITVTGPQLIFHMFYFYQNHSFLISFEALLAIYAALYISPKIQLKYSCLSLIAVFLMLYANKIFVLIPETTNRRAAVDLLNKELPEDAVLISKFDDAYLDPYFIRGKKRRAIPASREVEYASKLISYDTIPNPDPFPARWSEHRSSGLINAGAIDAVPFTAINNQLVIQNFLTEGRKVYFDSSQSSIQEIKIMQQIYTMYNFPDKKYSEITGIILK